MAVSIVGSRADWSISLAALGCAGDRGLVVVLLTLQLGSA